MKIINLVVSYFVIFLISITPIASQIAICKTNLEVQTMPFSCNYTLSPEEIDDGSSDYDSLYLNEYELVGVGLYEVTLTAAKTTGETTTCSCQVNFVDKSPPIVLLKQDITIQMDSTNTFNLTPEMFDNGSFDFCGPVTLSIEPSFISCELVSSGQFFLTVTDEAGNYNQGWTTIEVLYYNILDFNICDNLSRCAPEGDCDSGHTINDDVEWPCDITVHNAPQSLIQSPNPNDLANYLNVPLSEVKPILLNIHECSVIGESIENQSYLIDSFTTLVKRTFSYTNFIFPSGTNPSYTQNILFTSGTTNTVDEAINNLTLYPNPVTDKLNFDVDDSINISKISIVNNNGVICSSLNDPQSNVIDISHLSNGMYFVKFEYNNGLQVLKKMVKI